MSTLVSRISALFSTLVVAAVPARAEPVVSGTYQLTPANTDVAFAIDNFWGVVTSRGKFTAVKGEFKLAEPLQNSRVAVTIDTKSIDTGIGKRDEHLRSADFFAVEVYPVMTFQSTKVSGSLEAFEVEGTLTLKAATKAVTLKGSLDKEAAEITAQATINRQDFGVSYSGKGLSDEVLIELKLRPNAVTAK